MVNPLKQSIKILHDAQRKSRRLLPRQRHTIKEIQDLIISTLITYIYLLITVALYHKENMNSQCSAVCINKMIRNRHASYQQNLHSNLGGRVSRVPIVSRNNNKITTTSSAVISTISIDCVTCVHIHTACVCIHTYIDIY